MRAVLVPPVDVWRCGDAYIFDRKFYDGMLAYCDLWPGKMACVAWQALTPPPPFGLVKKTKDQLPFDLQALLPGAILGSDDLGDADVVVGSADDHRQLLLPHLSMKPSIMTVEYTPSIRRDIINAEVRNRIRRLRRHLWMRRVEHHRQDAIGASAGIETNGIPAHEFYRAMARSSLLYFDTRADKSMQISQKSLDEKASKIFDRQPLRCAFSGRLIAMKGIGALMAVARTLQAGSVPFTLDVFGDGDLSILIESESKRNKSVKFHGPVDFATKLMPTFREGIDIFICCHQQGDPSCTYLETFACGVPIVGFANESLAGLEKCSRAACTVRMNDTKALADLIEMLHVSRDRLVEMSRAAASFSRTRSFEDTFASRVQYWQQIATAPQAVC